MPKLIGKRLKYLRGSKTQGQVAEGLGISRARYSHYENEHVEPDSSLLVKMAEYYDVSTDYLLGRSDTPHLSEEEEFKAFANNPELDRFYRELPQSDEEDLEKLRAMWEIIKKKDK